MPSKPTITDDHTLYRKRLIVCCDGTGQASSTGRAEFPTNVSRLVQALKTSHIRTKRGADGKLKVSNGVEEVPQIVLYQTGVGSTGVTRFSNAIAGAFGRGIDGHILEAYCFLANNYEKGDEVFLFGFSRGAFTARAVASLMCNAGLLQKESLGYLPKLYEAYKKRRNTQETQDAFEIWRENEGKMFKYHEDVVVTILGVWDTVASIGIPKTWISDLLGLNWLRELYNSQYSYHDTSFPGKRDHQKKDPRAYVNRAFQALSLDENRNSFQPVLLRFPRQPSGNPEHGPDFQQCWFPGVHTDVGGGYERDYRDISDLSFAWMVDMCWPYLNFHNLSTILKQSVLYTNEQNNLVEKKPVEKRWGLTLAHDEIKASWMFRLGGSSARKPKQYYLDQRFGDDGEVLPDHKRVATHEYIHASVRRRMMESLEDGSPWKPPALAGFKLEKDEEDDKGWKWVKRINVNGKWQSIAIREWMPGSGCPEQSEESALLDEDVQRALRDDAAVKNIKFVEETASRLWIARLAIVIGVAAAWYLHSNPSIPDWVSRFLVPISSFLSRYNVGL